MCWGNNSTIRGSDHERTLTSTRTSPSINMGHPHSGLIFLIGRSTKRFNLSEEVSVGSHHMSDWRPFFFTSNNLAMGLASTFPPKSPMIGSLVVTTVAASMATMSRLSRVTQCPKRRDSACLPHFTSSLPLSRKVYITSALSLPKAFTQDTATIIGWHV